MRSRVLACFALLFLPVSAVAQEAPTHQLSAYLRSGGGVLLAPSRSMGGFGGGLGVRDVVKDTFVLQADVSYLAGLGHVALVRAGAGIQKPGVWSPAALVTASLLAGDHLAFRTDSVPNVSRGPAGALGIALAPLRFSASGRCISVFELGVAYGTDGNSAGPVFQLGLLELGVSF